MLRTKLAFILILSTVGSLAFAKPASKNALSSEALETEREREFSIPVPQSEIQLEPLRFKPSRPVEMAAGISNWAPDNFRRSSYSKVESRFEKTDLPGLSINRIGEIYSFDSAVNLSSVIGFSYFTMERAMNRSASGASTGSSTESVNFFMARAGIESTWSQVLPWRIEPKIGFAVLPTFLTAHQSQFEDSFSVFGLPLEATAGLLWRTTSGNRADFGDLSVGISGQAVSGSVAGSSLQGLGLLGELRISL